MFGFRKRPPSTDVPYRFSTTQRFASHHRGHGPLSRISGQFFSLRQGRWESVALGGVQEAHSIALSNDRIAFGQDGEVKLRHLSRLTGVGTRLSSKDRVAITALCFSPSGARLIAGNARGDLIVWDVNTRERVYEQSSHAGYVECVQFEPTGKIFASASDDGFVKLWNSETGCNIRTIKASDEAIMSVAFSQDGIQLVCGGYDYTAKLWLDWESARDDEAITFAGHSDGIESVMLPPDGKTLITASGDNTLRVWDIEERQERLLMRGHTNAVHHADLSSDGTLLISAGRDATVRFWRAATPKEVEAAGEWWKN